VDKSKYKYQELELPNVLLESPLGSLSSPPPTIMPDWHTLIYMAAKKKPNWVVMIPRDQSLVVRFLVYEQGEVLGKVSQEYMNSGKKFVVKPSRGAANKTKDPKKAASFVFKNFSRRTQAEILVEAAREAKQRTYAVASNATVEYKASENELFRTLEQYITDNWSAVEAAALQDGGNKTLIQSYPERQTKAAAAKKLVNGLVKGHIVVLRDNQYHICDTNGQLQHTYVDTTLPPYYKKAVGMLKLVDPNEMVAGYGVRATDDIFYVCEEENET
jgi:hypothetical protein